MSKPDSDAMHQIIKRVLWEQIPVGLSANAFDEITDDILSALSDAGLAVLPLEATEQMHCGAEFLARDWAEMAAAFHPSQLEKTDE